ncbi:hypothetical protein [Crenothrix sp.]|uniref:hypothetical protein n=1 Tax=Crenothrix sp. TaxID=3100433 RepID=UPI00374CF799
MSTTYSEEELNLLTNTPHIIGAAMAFAGNSGLFGTGKEMFTMAQSVMAGVKDYPNNALIQSILPNSQEGTSEAMAKLKKIRDWGSARMKANGVDSAQKFIEQAITDSKAVAELLAGKASVQESNDYKQWCLAIAEKVAMATTEGSFLGFGGERFSTNEKNLLVEFQSAMGIKSNLT